MLRFNTLVAMTLMLWGVFSGNVMAQGTPPATTPPTAPTVTPAAPAAPAAGTNMDCYNYSMLHAKYMEAANTPENTKKAVEYKKEFVDCQNRQRAASTGVVFGDCNYAQQTYQEQLRAFSKECAKTKVSDPMKCGKAVARCSCQFSNLDDKQKETLDCPENSGAFAASISRVRSFEKNREPINMTKADQDLSVCPLVSAEDAEKINAELGTLKGDLKTLAADIPVKEEAVEKAQSEMEEKMTAIDNDRQEAEDKKDEAIDQIKTNQTTKSSQITADYYSGLDMLSNAKAALDSLEVELKAEEVNYLAKRSEWDLQCHDQAYNTIRDMQSRVLAKMMNGTYIRGDQNAALNNTGETARQMWQRLQKFYYDQCLRSDMKIREEKKIAAKTYGARVAAIMAKRPQLERQLDLADKKVNEIKNGKGCLGADPAAPADADCKNAREAQQKMAMVTDSYNKKRKLFDQRRVTAMDLGTKNKQRAQTALTKAQDEYSTTQARVDNYQAYLQLTDNKGNLLRDDARAILFASFADMNSAAAQIVTCSTKDTASCNDSADCVKAKDYLTSIGQEILVQKDTPPIDAAKIASDAQKALDATQSPGHRGRVLPPQDATRDPAAAK